MESGADAPSISQQTFVGGATPFSAAPRPDSMTLSVMIARAPNRMITPRDAPCVPVSQFDMMHVMWLIVGFVRGKLLATLFGGAGIRPTAMLSPSTQLLPFCGAWMTSAFLTVPE